MAVQAAELGERVMSVRGGGAWRCPLLTSPTPRSSRLASLILHKPRRRSHRWPFCRLDSVPVLLFQLRYPESG